MTTGILGGVFDPPHNGHLALARAAIDHFALDRLLVLVAARPGHKGVVLDAPERLRLAEAAFAEVPEAEVELDEHPFTVDLVADGRLRDALFILGADELASFQSWKEPDRVLDELRLAVGTRPGYPRESLERAIEKLGRRERIELFDLPEPHDVSSTDIRERAKRGQTLDRLVPPGVAELIEREHLYRP